MKVSHKARENIKTAIIVVLSLSTILLLYFYWYQTPFERFKITPAVTDIEIPPITEIVIPEQIVLSFGEENYCIAPIEKNDLWYGGEQSLQSDMIREFRKFSNSENILTEEITESQYNQVFNYRYIKAEFSYAMPFVDFCEIYEVKRPSSYSSIENINQLAYSEGSEVSLFIKDSIKNKYYRLFSDKDMTNFKRIILEVEQSQHDIYYPLGTFLGIENNTLIPVFLDINDTPLLYKQEVYPYDQDEINDIAKKFFGESFDFIRKITENSGKIIYMYGYGEKVFIVNADGSMEFKEKFDGENYATKKYFEALNIAVKFIGLNGGLYTAHGEPIKLYLKDVTETTKGQKGHRFVFGQLINDTKLQYESGAIVEVEVVGGQVTYYYRNIIELDERAGLESDNEMPPDALSAINMLAQNYQYINQAIGETAVGKELVENTFEAVAKTIKSVDTAYLKLENTENTGSIIYPAWVVEAEECQIFFGLYDWKPLCFTEIVKNEKN